ncbi:MerR family transcriptional regulator [Pseudoclavibacter sp. RFBG4]|uniref:MerR family transcriptional regulator n=1 Tax=Pseudoclavibacter sp. RFBG4 TaxID=2080575 RepID=UPI000CE7FC1A|nr:MerR family transcriptional regulator [Pseudoclavibacter sp. RFBG4]PPG26715.1 MerR family transcriptional regulator [Pseudoclavibacter sp. RFBG4]
MAEETMQIGKLADRTGMSIRSLRHYDEIGLLVPSARTEGGFRLYTAEDEERLLLIRRMKPMGYSLEQMRELLDVVDELEAHPENTENRARLDEIRREALERQAKLRKQVTAADEFVERLAALP